MADDNKYILDLGVRSNDIVTQLNDTINKIEETQKKASALTEEMGKGFKEAAAENKKVGETIVVTNKALEVSKERINQVGTEVKRAFDDKSVISMQKKIEDFKKKVDEVSTNRKIGFSVEESEFKKIEALSESLKKSYEEMQKALSEQAEALKSRSADTAETVAFNAERVEELNAKLKELNANLGKTAPGVMQANIQAQINETTKELDFQEQELKESRGTLKSYEEEIKKVSQAQKDLSASLVNSQRELKVKTDQEAKAQAEIKKLEEAERKRNEEMHNTTEVTSLLDDVTGGLISRFQAVTATVKGVTAGFNTMKLALISTGIGAFVVLLGSLVAYFKQSEEGQDKFAYYMNIIGTVTSRVIDVVADFGKVVLDAVTNPVQSIKDFGNAVAENIINRFKGILEFLPELSKAIILVFKGDFTEAGNVAVNAIGKVGLGVEDTSNKIKGLTKDTKEWLEETKRAAKEAGEISNLRAEITVKERELLIEQAQATRDIAELREKVAQKDLYNSEQRVAFMQKAAKIEDDIAIKRLAVAKMQEDAQIRQNALSHSTTEDLDAQARATANVMNVEAERNRNQRRLQRELQSERTAASNAAKALEKEELRNRQKTNENILKYASALEESVLSIMKDSIEKRNKIIEEDYRNKIDTLKLETLRTNEEVEARNKLIEQLEIEKNYKLLEERKKYEKERISLQLEARNISANLQKDSLNNELELLDIDHQQRLLKINELFKDEESTRLRLISELEESTERTRLEVKNKWTEQIIREEELRGILTAEMIFNNGARSEKAEHALQVEILRIRTDAAKERIEQLRANGEDENSLIMLQAQALYADLRAKHEEEIKNAPPTSIWDILGIDFGADSKAIDNAIGVMFSNVQSMTSLIIDSYDQQISKKQEAIKAIDSDINELEKQLDKEKDLREKGFANNVELIEEEINEKQRQREEELLMLEELNEKKKEIQKAQFVMDTIAQTQNLITASSDIYKSLAPLGPFGIGLAIATIATMFGSFAMQKVKASQIANTVDVSKYEQGGLLKGERHSRGGVKFYSEDRTNIKELEGGEFVINRKQTAKFLPMLEAINKGVFRKELAREESFLSMLDDLGIRMQGDSFERTINIAGNAEELKIMVENNNESSYKEMLYYLKRIDDHGRNSAVSKWQEGDRTFIRIGNKTTIINKDNGEN